MKFKSIVSLILIAALSMTLTGCMKNDDADGERKIAVLTEAEPAVIKLGTVGYTNLEPAVNMFNAENNLGIKIEITYYRDGIAQGDILQQAVTRLNMELAAGEGPDIIDFENFPGRSSYLKQGFLLDMTPYFQRDLKIEDYYGLDVINKDGMHYFGQAYSIMCLSGLESVFGDRPGWTPAEYIEYVGDAQSGIGAETRDSFIERMIIYGALPQFVDFERGICSFDSEEFAELLEYAGSLRESASEPDDSSYEQALASGKLLYFDALIRSPYDISELEAEAGNELSFIGYPSADGKGGSFLYTQGLMGVNANTAHAAEAWEFIKFILDSEEVQGRAGVNAIPVKKSVMDEKIDELQHPYRKFEGQNITINEDGSFNADGVYQDAQYDSEPLITERQLEKFYKLLAEAATPYEFDKKIYRIITQCAESYFSGEKGLREVTADIESRVYIYLEENK